MNRQTTNRVLMVRPVRFAFNEETAANNAFQQKSRSEAEARCVQQQAVAEFDAFVALLRQNGVMVDVLQDMPEPFTPMITLTMSRLLCPYVVVGRADLFLVTVYHHSVATSTA